MIFAIIQARMSSSRLPGKSMAKVSSRTLISILLERVSKSEKIDEIIVAIPDTENDDILSEHINELGYKCFRGDEKDVLSRYYNAYCKFKGGDSRFDSIVRITGDCPFVEPKLIDKLINKYKMGNYDYVALSEKYAEGLDVEIFSNTLLEEAFFNAKISSEREHVTLYFHNNKKRFRMYRLQNKTDDSKYRVTVDEEEDLKVIRLIYESFIEHDIEINIKNIKSFLDNNKDIFCINSHIIRNEGLIKSLKMEKKFEI